MANLTHLINRPITDPKFFPVAVESATILAGKMRSSPPPPLTKRTPFPGILLLLLLYSLSFLAGADESVFRSGRSLMGFKEKLGNATYGCSPAGPCVACRYPEKNDEKYRCSETGYRIPLKCVKITDDSMNSDSQQKGRSVLDMSITLHASRKILKSRRFLEGSTPLESMEPSYITYRSCVPKIREENVTVLGFEGIMLIMLATSGTVLYFRRKRSVAMSGAAPARIPTNSRF